MVASSLGGELHRACDITATCRGILLFRQSFFDLRGVFEWSTDLI